MKTVISVITLALVLLAAAMAQQTEPSNFAAGGISYAPGASPSIAGTGLYARAANGQTGTFAFTVVDALPVSVKPFSVTTQISAGVAQRIVTIAGIPIYVPTAAGVSYSGTNTGWAWSTGGLAVVPIKGQWRVLPSLRVVKSSVSSGAGYQLIGGVLFGYGW